MNTHVNLNEDIPSPIDEKEAYTKKQQETLEAMKIGSPDVNGYLGSVDNCCLKK